ncbi:hypothetical protein D9758_013817 [Tetrapyrgos nigripes]|uniref:C2H2-type domain-containing protein n=1 Tax=Tetrapyrgos nigripes TaxID=182062 RepID=A0A8H5FST9_9AGAR|nr:hypothetical protein D9758_013817 [Tetrapyrgos nigripes]
MNTSEGTSPITTLPSLQEMFPEHLLSLPPSVRLSIMTTIKTSSPLGIRTTDIGDFSRHSKRPMKRPSNASSSFKLESFISRTPAPSSRDAYDDATSPRSSSPSTSSPSWTDEDQMDVDGEVDEGEDLMTDPGRRHTCAQCGKRFNRPSSLRIHTNVHTGETPFRCPYPGCGRLFNVNSNMRRHYRNHVITANPAIPVGSEVIDYSMIPRQRGRRNSKQVSVVAPEEPMQSTPLPSSRGLSGSTPVPVLKKAQWSFNSDSDSGTRNPYAFDSDEGEVMAKSSSFEQPVQQMTETRVVSSPQSQSHAEFNYPVYTSRRRHSNHSYAYPTPSPSLVRRSSMPNSNSGIDMFSSQSDRPSYERRHSPSRSPRSSLVHIARLIR